MATVAAPGFRALAALAAFFAFVLFAPGNAAAADSVTPADTLEQNLAAQINNYRAAHGLRKLAVHWRLQRAASRHSVNLANWGYFSHNWSTGAAFGTWIRWWWPGPGYSNWSAGENLYWAAPDTGPTGVVRAWKNSPGHNANLLRSSWRSIGVGAMRVRNPAGYYGSYGSITIVAAEFGYRR